MVKVLKGLNLNSVDEMLYLTIDDSHRLLLNPTTEGLKELRLTLHDIRIMRQIMLYLFHLDNQGKYVTDFRTFDESYFGRFRIS